MSSLSCGELSATSSRGSEGTIRVRAGRHGNRQRLQPRDRSRPPIVMDLASIRRTPVELARRTWPMLSRFRLISGDFGQSCPGVGKVWSIFYMGRCPNLVRSLSSSLEDVDQIASNELRPSSTNSWRARWVLHVLAVFCTARSGGMTVRFERELSSGVAYRAPCVPVPLHRLTIIGRSQPGCFLLPSRAPRC